MHRNKQCLNFYTDVLNTNKLNNFSSAYLHGVGSQDFSGDIAYMVSVDNEYRVVPASYYQGDIGVYIVLRQQVTVNPTTGKVALKIKWWTDGVIYYNYIDMAN